MPFLPVRFFLTFSLPFTPQSGLITFMNQSAELRLDINTEYDPLKEHGTHKNTHSRCVEVVLGSVPDPMRHLSLTCLHADDR